MAPVKLTRPNHYPYQFRALLDFPRRLFNPPKAGVGAVRSFKVTPIYEVALNDVLDGKHLPPLGLKEFEEYLLFVEHSAENLYFIFWLRDYYAKYKDWESSEKASSSSPELTISFNRAKGTFFETSSPLELNLPAEIVEALVTSKDSYPYPRPDALADIQKQVEIMLQESLMKFVGGSCGNSGRNRGLFGIAVGLAAMAVGLAPVLLSILDPRSRLIRISALLPFWFGAMVVIASLHGVCVIIFLFGDARQLYPFELARPSLSIPSLPNVNLLPLPVTSGVKEGNDLKQSPSEANLDVDRKMSMSSSNVGQQPASTYGNRTAVDSSERGKSPHQSWSFDETAGFITPYPSSIHSGTPSSSAPLKFDFDSLPSVPKPDDSARKSYEFRTMPTRGVFCSLTKVVSPVITRAQWEIVMRSAMLGVVVALILTGVVLAIPPKGQ